MESGTDSSADRFRHRRSKKLWIIETEDDTQSNLWRWKPNLTLISKGRLNAVIKRSSANELGPIEVQVRDNNVNRAIQQLKREVGREGLGRELKRRRFYMKPSVAKRIKSIEAERRRRKDEANRRKRRDY
jgi:small subunit ribosomal protein S21